MSLDTSPFGSASELARAIKKRQLSPVEAARHYLAVVDRRNSELNAFTWRRDEDLLAEARQAEKVLMTAAPAELPPFFGVPIPIKDLAEVHGHPTTHGSMATKDKIGRFDSTSVRRLKEAGFLIMGRTNSPEFGTLPVTENDLYGATRNPWNPARTAGGSSGGAAAAVASGMAPIAHASDGGGSIRIPASACGLVGLKASRARIPKGPLITDVMHGISTDGCVSSSVEDTAAMLDVLAWRDPNAWYGVERPARSFAASCKDEPRKLRIAVTTAGPIPMPVEDSSVAAVEYTAKILRDLGHDVFDGAPAWGEASATLAQDFITLWTSSTAYLEVRDFSKLEKVNSGLRALCEKLTVPDYIQAVLRLQLFSRQVTTAFGRDFDLLLTPTLAMEPPRIGWIFEGKNDDAVSILMRCTEFVPFCGWCNVTGQPAISLPTFVAKSGLPVGVQLVAAPLREDLLLGVARQVEEVVNWSAVLPR